MNPVSRIFLCLAFAVLLTSCDRVKHGLLTVVKEGAAKATGSLIGTDNVLLLDESTYQQFIETTESVAVVVYHSDACSACASLDPVLQRVVAGAPGPVKLGRVDVNSEPEFTRESQVVGLPDVRMFLNGVQVDRFVGAEDEQMIRRKLTAQLDVLSSGKLPSPKPKEKGDVELQDNLLKKPMDKDWLPPGMERH